MLLKDFSIPLFLWQLFLLGLIALWAYFLYEIVTSEFPGKEGTLWALLVFFVPFIGVLAYLAYGRSSRMEKE